MLNPEKAQSCLELHNIFTCLSSDKICISFSVLYIIYFIFK